MKISVKQIRPANSHEWDEIWDKCTYATFFHSREWAEIWNKYTNGIMIPAPKLFLFSDGTKAIIPISKEKKYWGLKTIYTSSPAGTYGGWISENELNEEHVKSLIDYMKSLRNLTWRINPFGKLALNSNINITKEDETHALNLSIGYESIIKGMTKGHRSAIQKAKKNRVKVQTASTLKEWEDYYQIYQKSIQRWGNNVSTEYNWDLFKIFWLLNSPNIKLWLAIYEDLLVGGGICFYSFKHTVYWHGAALEQYFNLRPINLLISEMIKYSCEKGFSWFDFNPSGSYEGVKSFKKSFGAKEFASPVIINNRVLFPKLGWS